MVPASDRGERPLSEPATSNAASPCIGVCTLRAGTDLCDGCLRTVAEITEWRDAPAQRRVQILASVDERRTRLGSGRTGKDARSGPR